jgi:chromate reductase
LTGGVRAQAQLNEVLLAIAAQPVLRPQAVIPTVHQKMAHGRFAGQTSRDFLKAGIDDLLRDIQRKTALSVQQES